MLHYCKHCGRKIVLNKGLTGQIWMHVIIIGDVDELYRYCRTTNAEPTK